MINTHGATVEQIKNEKDPFKKALLIRSKMKSGGAKMKNIAKELHKTSSYICHLLRLLNLPTIIIDGYYSHTVSLSHLFIISRLKNQKDAIKAYEQVLVYNYTVQQLEEYVREKLYHIRSSGERIDTHTKQNIEKLFKSIDSDIAVSIVQTRIRATVAMRIKGDMRRTSEMLRKIVNRF